MAVCFQVWYRALQFIVVSPQCTTVQRDTAEGEALLREPVSKISDVVSVEKSLLRTYVFWFITLIIL